MKDIVKHNAEHSLASKNVSPHMGVIKGSISLKSLILKTVQIYTTSPFFQAGWISL